MFGISYSSDPEKMGSLTSQIQKVYVHDVGSGDQSTSLGGGIESPNMHLTPWKPH